MESIKISRRNLGYISKLTRRISSNYRKAIGPQNQIRNHQNTAEDNNRYKQDMCETTVAKNKSKGNSSPHKYFTEHLVSELENAV
jgi:hypothetical protein